MIAEINVRLDYGLEGLTTVLLQVEAAALADQRILDAHIDLNQPAYFARVPAEDFIGERCWVRVDGRLQCTYTAKVEVDRPALDLTRLSATPTHELPGDVVKYLMDSRFIQAEKFHQFVKSEFGGVEGGAKIVAIRDWVEANFEYMAGFSDAETTAADTFIVRKGVCRDYAHVMVCLARACEIPARMVSVYAATVQPPDFHAVAEVYLDGTWHLVDATGMAKADEIVRIGVGRDAADVSFMMIFGKSVLNNQNVAVKRV